MNPVIRPTFDPLAVPLILFLALGVVELPALVALLAFRVPLPPSALLHHLWVIPPAAALMIYQSHKAGCCRYEIGATGVRIDNWWFSRSDLEVREEHVEIPYVDIFEIRIHRNWMQRCVGLATLIVVVPGSQATVTFDDYRIHTLRVFDWFFGHGESRDVFRLYDVAEWREIEAAITPRLTRPNPFRRAA